MEAFPNKNTDPYDRLTSCSMHLIDPVHIMACFLFQTLAQLKSSQGFIHRASDKSALRNTHCI